MVEFSNLWGTTQIKCPKCGEWAKVNTNVVLTSYPPQYGCSCPHCENVFYIFCHELGTRTDIKHVSEGGDEISESLKVGPNDTIAAGDISANKCVTWGTTPDGTTHLVSNGTWSLPTQATKNYKAISIPFNFTVTCERVFVESDELSLLAHDADGFLAQFDKIRINGVEFERKR